MADQVKVHIFGNQKSPNYTQVTMVKTSLTVMWSHLCVLPQLPLWLHPLMLGVTEFLSLFHQVVSTCLFLIHIYPLHLAARLISATGISYC